MNERVFFLNKLTEINLKLKSLEKNYQKYFPPIDYNNSDDPFINFSLEINKLKDLSEELIDFSCNLSWSQIGDDFFYLHHNDGV